MISLWLTRKSEATVSANKIKSKPKVMIVDDEPDITAVLKKGLEQHGFELYRKIRDIDPQVKVCFLTAFEIYYDEFRRIFPKLHIRCFARKPVMPAELKKIITTELEAELPDH